jgi:hypothetical protein
MLLRKGQLKTYDQAVVTPTQHKKPCVDCPFGRIAVKGWIPETPEGWLQKAHGEGRFECHTTKRHDDEPWQCAGAATFRANVCKAPRDRSLLVLPQNKKLVFASNQEFFDHHRKEIFPTRRP